jgi:hypothetical protein
MSVYLTTRILLTGSQRMEFYYMVNYYFKYLELLDTIFLALKKKPLREQSLLYGCSPLLNRQDRISARVSSLRYRPTVLHTT